MALYRQYSVNPMAGCLPMLIQIPIFFGLYRAIASSLRQGSRTLGVWTESFLWLPDLGEPDPYKILPILAGVFQFVQTKMMRPADQGKITDPQQAMMNTMMNFMPLMVVFFGWNFASGAVLYWVTQSVYTVVQQWFITGWGSLKDWFPACRSCRSTAGSATARRATSTMSWSSAARRPRAEGRHGLDAAQDGGGQKQQARARAQAARATPAAGQRPGGARAERTQAGRQPTTSDARTAVGAARKRRPRTAPGQGDRSAADGAGRSRRAAASAPTAPTKRAGGRRPPTAQRRRRANRRTARQRTDVTAGDGRRRPSNRRRPTMSVRSGAARQRRRSAASDAHRFVP